MGFGRLPYGFRRVTVTVTGSQKGGLTCGNVGNSIGNRGENGKIAFEGTIARIKTAKDGAVMALVPNQIPGESEYSHGPGMFPNPKVDYDPNGGRSGLPKADPTLQDQLLEMAAYKRTNAARAGETLEEMQTAYGNPDRYGPAPALVQTPDVTLPPTVQDPFESKFERRP